MSNWQPKRLRPGHLMVIELHFKGHTNDEICNMTGYCQSVVSQIVTSPVALELLEQMRERVFDTISDVQLTAQAFAPRAFQTIMELAVGAKTESVKKSAADSALAIAGHVPVNRVQLEDVRTPPSPFDGKTEDEIREKLIADVVGAAPGIKAPPTTVH